MPITPVRILWVNMITAVTLSLAIAFEAPQQDVMRRPPRSPRAPVLSGFLLWRAAFVTVLMVSGGIGLFLWELHQGAPLPKARTAGEIAIVAGEIAYLFNARSNGCPGERNVHGRAGAVGRARHITLLCTSSNAFRVWLV